MKDPGLRYPAGTDLTPRKDVPSAEWHLTYACDLDCIACNRASFLRKPHTPDMTLADAEDFIRQARALNWEPIITIIGGEPTVHKDFLGFVEMAYNFANTRVRVFSNGHRQIARDLCDQVSRKYGTTIMTESYKTDTVKAVTGFAGWVDDIFISPHDFGEPLRIPCFSHCSIACGISVDSVGYAPCAMGGMVDALLGTERRTKVLADLFDKEKVAETSAIHCAQCGHRTPREWPDQKAAHQAKVEKCETKFGVPMSPTWFKAFEGRR